MAPELLMESAMRSRLVLVLLSAAACGAQDAGSAGGPSSDAGAGVSFGGAQDIGEFRSILDRGEIPGPSTLDANGFFNEHFNEPPVVTCGGPLCLTPGLSVGKDFLTGAHQAALQISINTTIDPAQFPRLPMKLVVVVDHSGSMAEDQRLEKVKSGLHTLIDNLKDEDRLAIISFDDVVTFDAPFGATLDRVQLHGIVESLSPRGGTNIFDGLKAGFTMLGESPENEKQNRIIFLSDGLATVGNTSQSAIIEMATTGITHGIGLTTIGVGNSFDVELMRGLAERGAGNFYYVEDATAATEVFTEELDYFMSPLALDLRIEATAAPGWDFAEVVGSTLWTASPRTGSMQVPAVFVASRTSQGPGPMGRRGGGSMIFIHLNPTAHEAGKVAEITLSYRQPNSTERLTHTVSLDYDRDPTETLEQPYLSYPGMAERYAMYNLFLGFRLATEYATSDWSCAAAALAATRQSAVAWNQTHEDPDIALDLALLDQFLGNLGERGGHPDQGLATCPRATDPYPPACTGRDCEQGNDLRCGCSTGRGGTTGLVIVGAVLAVMRRRRRR
ncbi:MAG: Myxococcales trans domain protein [Deltaproteobacteria bacterium]|nr:Myxococcales trans domain protein [Deltaproteobacteria bacterium]